MNIQSFLVPSSLPLSGNELYGGLFWTVYAVWIGSEIFVLGRRSAARTGSAVVRDRGSLRLLRVTIPLGVLSCFMSATRARSTSFDQALRPLFYAGVTLMIAGLLLRWWAVRSLGRYFTIDVAVHSDQPIVQTGPYRLIRHPAYTGSVLTFIGIALALGTWLGLLLMLFFVLTGFSVRIHIEEAALTAALGEPYQVYRRRSWRLLPGIF